MCRHRFLWFACVSLLFLPLTLNAQTTTGTVRGYVRDQNGAPVAGAVIQARQTETGVLRSASTRSDGSFFVNPVIPAGELDSLLRRAREAGIAQAGVPRFAAAGGIKLSAGWLIEHAGFAKGHRHGNVGLSSKHALAIVNRGGGTAREVRELVAAIREAVESRFGVRLEPEPNLVGPPRFAWEGAGSRGSAPGEGGGSAGGPVV